MLLAALAAIAVMTIATTRLAIRVGSGGDRFARARLPR